MRLKENAKGPEQLYVSLCNITHSSASPAGLAVRSNRKWFTKKGNPCLEKLYMRISK